MAAESHSTSSAAVTTTTNQQDKRHRSIFDVPANFFESCRLLQSPSSVTEPSFEIPTVEALALDEKDDKREQKLSKNLMQKWTCNTCKAEFDSLQDQRSHFKSDIHRFNIKLSIAGKETVKEEDFDESTSDSFFKDNDISSISGSEDEDDKLSGLRCATNGGLGEGKRKKLFLQLQTGGRVSIWRCLLMNESENISFDKDKDATKEDNLPYQTDREVIERLNNLIHEPRDSTHFRIVLLARGGHFAGCVFDGNFVVAHKTFHRYVIRARAGKKQSSKDASGKIAHSAGASIRRHNEFALKKEIQELLVAWKPYFDASSCIFIHAPSSNRQLLFDGEKPCFSDHQNGVRHIPVTVRRPTLKEAKRLYGLLTLVSEEADEEIMPIIKDESKIRGGITNDGYPGSRKEVLGESTKAPSGVQELENLSISSESDEEYASTPLHEAARSNDSQKILELLEQGLDPCIKDERGKSPYELATEKEVRNTFRRFMASNLDKWDWHVAKVPSPLTKEMEESQNAKQAEKDAKRKARSKELKKLRKAREKKTQAESAQPQNVLPVSGDRGTASNPVIKGRPQHNGGSTISKEEEQRRAQAAEREKRAAAAERRLAAAAALKTPNSGATSSNPLNNVITTDIKCSCCDSSLAGKVPFHRYNYKYCSSTCMHVHREIIEDG